MNQTHRLTYIMMGILPAVFLRAATSPEEEKPMLIKRVEQLMHINPQVADIPSALAAVIQGLDKLEVDDNTLNNLVDSLTQGDREYKLYYLFINDMHIGNTHKISKYGSIDSLSKVVHLLWERAQKMEKSDPAKSANYTKASLLLAAYAEPYVSNSQIISRLKDPDRVARMAQLSETEHDALKQLAKSESGANFKIAEALSLLYDNHDQMIESSKDAFAFKDMPHALSLIEEFRSSHAGGLYEQYCAIRFAWELLNMARAKKSTEGVAQISARMTQWKETTSNENIKRWIQEALDTQGLMPSIKAVSTPMSNK